MNQQKGRGSEPGKAKRRTLDALGLLALLLFNFAALAGFGRANVADLEAL
jgi:hypothetical protein